MGEAAKPGPLHHLDDSDIDMPLEFGERDSWDGDDNDTIGSRNSQDAYDCQTEALNSFPPLVPTRMDEASLSEEQLECWLAAEKQTGIRSGPAARAFKHTDKRPSVFPIDPSTLFLKASKFR